LFLTVALGVPAALAWAIETYAPWLPAAVDAAVAPAEPVMRVLPVVLLAVVAWLVVVMMQYFGGVAR
jgi:hypothetical protein